MSLLANQLSLSIVQLKNDNINQASQRLRTTSQTYPQNYILNTNKSICNRIISSSQQSNQQKQNLVQQFISLIQKNPLNYVGYYNLFNLYLKFNNNLGALNSLYQCIAAIYLQKGQKQKSQKQVAKGLKYCQNSILAHLIKAITHVQNQKYVLAINDLDWILNQSYTHLQIKLKIKVFSLTKIIYQSLGQVTKAEEISKVIQNVKKSSQNQNINKIQRRLISTMPVSQDNQRIIKQIEINLKQFLKLLIQTQQIKSFKKSSKLPQLLLKQINDTHLNKNNLNLESFIQKLDNSIHQSLIYIKNQQNIVGDNKSSGLSNNASQDLIYNPNSSNYPKISDMKKQSNKKQNKNISVTNQTLNDSMRNSIDQQQANKLNMSLNNSFNNSLNNSLNTSGIKGKKKTQIIYPLDKQSQQVEIKIVMAQLTNNKQIMGKMDPYCLIKYNKIEKKTSIINGGGLEPRWNQSFIFQLSQNPSEIEIQVYDHQTYFRKDDFVGSGKLILQKNGFIKVAIFQNEKPAGTVFVSIKSKN